MPSSSSLSGSHDSDIDIFLLDPGMGDSTRDVVTNDNTPHK